MPVSDMAGMPRSRICGGPPTSGSNCTVEPIATRGERLVLTRARSRTATSNQAFHVDVLSIVETNADERIGAVVMFDLEDFEAAFAELDARYLAGEAAAHAHTWSVIMQGLRRAQPARDFPRRHQIGSTSTTGEGHRSRLASCSHYSRRMERHVRPEQLRRGGASAEQPRSGHYPRGA